MRYRLPLPWIGALLLALGALPAACTQLGEPASPAASPVGPTPTPSPTPEPPRPPSPPATPDAGAAQGSAPPIPMPVDDPLAQATELARADLGTRLRVPPAEIEVLSAERVIWPDGSLGCPQPDMYYTQAVVDGYRIIVGRQGRVYAYHAGPDARPFLCASEEPDGGYDFVPPPGFDD